MNSRRAPANRRTNVWLATGGIGALVSLGYFVTAATKIVRDGSPGGMSVGETNLSGGSAIVVPLMALACPALAILSGLVLWSDGIRKRSGVVLLVSGILLVFGNLLTRLL